MDGINISNSNMKLPGISVGETGLSQNTTSTQKAEEGSSFGSTLKQAIQSVDSLQKDSDLKMQQLATGQNTNIHETMIAAEKADIALRMMVQVRNKMIEAYQEMMRMQV